MNANNSQQDLIAEAMRSIATSRIPAGMEARIAAAVHRRQQNVTPASPTLGTHKQLAWLAVSAALVAGALVIAYSSHDARISMPTNRASFTVPHHALPSMPAPVAPSSAHVHRTSARQTPLRLHRASTVHPRYEAAINPPPLPLTQQEKLLVALAQQPQILPQLRSIERSEKIAAHGLGQNSIFELATQPLQPLQPAPLGDFQ